MQQGLCYWKETEKIYNNLILREDKTSLLFAIYYKTKNKKTYDNRRFSNSEGKC